MKKLKLPKIILLSLRVGLGAMFVVSGIQKLTTPYQNFSAVIDKYEIVRGAVSAALAQGLPWLEFIAGIFFVLGFWETLALWILWAMNTAFIGALSSVLIRKIQIDSCGCFGEAVSLPIPKMLTLDICFWLLFLIYYVRSRKADLPSLDRYYNAGSTRKR